MWQEGIDAIVHAVVPFIIRTAAAFVERQTHLPAFYGNAIFAVV